MSPTMRSPQKRHQRGNGISDALRIGFVGRVLGPVEGEGFAYRKVPRITRPSRLLDPLSLLDESGEGALSLCAISSAC